MFLSPMAINMHVYKITNKLNGKEYVGVTTETAAKRWKRHCERAKDGTVTALYSAIRKYGKDAFEVQSLIEVGAKEDLMYYEPKCIKLYGTRAPNGYNLTDGGEDPFSGARHQCGEDRPLAKLNEDMIRFLRRPDLAHVTGRQMLGEVATRFHVKLNQSTLDNARTGRTWKHLNSKFLPVKSSRGARSQGARILRWEIN